MSDLLDRTLEPFRSELARLRPSDSPVVDAHTHLGLDEDGMSLDPAGLVGLLDDAGAAQALVFPLHDPERVPSYRVPNDRVLAWAAESGGRFIPFCRLDPADDPLPEAERCLNAGARGIKLHPRAQAFGMVGSGVEGIFATAEQARVPILIHAGRGLPETFGAELVEIAHKHPGAPLILAHLGVADQGILVDGLASHPAAVFDTSWMNPLDVFGLLARVGPERVVFGSDPPYGRTFTSLYMLLRVCASAGISEAVMREVVGAGAMRLVDGQELLPAGPPAVPSRIELDARLARIFSFCLMVFGSGIAGATDAAVGMLSLALAVCRDPNPGAAGPALERIAPCLEAGIELFRSGEQPRRALPPVMLSMAIAATEVRQGV